MSWSEEFGKLPITVKGMVASVAVCMPFWFVAIYLFDKPLFNTKDYPIIVSFCFCFSLTWYFINIVFAALIAHFVDEGNEDLDGILISGGIASILYLCATIVICYYYKDSFTRFLFYAYSYIIVRMFLLILFLIRRSSKSSNSNNTQVNPDNNPQNRA